MNKVLKFVNLVYDNIDFGEEVVKQTHVANGTITQKMTERDHRIHDNVKIIESQRSIKYTNTGEVLLPGWSGFKINLYENDIPEKSRVGYLPVINASPTEYSTINTILNRSTKIADKLELELEYSVLVFDEAVYAKVQQERGKEKAYFDRFVVRLGEFHVIVSYLSAISKIFGDGCLKDVLIESGIVRILHHLRTNFAVQRQSSHGFSAVACDQTIEKTANRDSKTKGGLVGFSMNRGAVHSWLMSQSERAAITRQCKYMAGMHSVSTKRKDLDKTRCKEHERSVNDVTATLSSMTNPFDTENLELINVSSGVVIEDKTADIILEAENLGEEQFSSFVRTNLMGDIPDIFAKIKRNNICSFSSSKTKIVKNSKGKEISLKTSRDFLDRLLVIAKRCDVNLREVLSYSLGVYPLSLSTPLGSLVKAAKSKLFEIVENLADKPEVDMKAFQENVLIVDAIAILQTAKGKWTTFGELADGIFKHLLGFAWNVARIDFIVDGYPSISIKNTQRSKRAEQGVQKVQIFNKEQKAPKQWKKYMSCRKK
eukprot:gene2899-3351_t